MTDHQGPVMTKSTNSFIAQPGNSTRKENGRKLVTVLSRLALEKDLSLLLRISVEYSLGISTKSRQLSVGGRLIFLMTCWQLGQKARYDAWTDKAERFVEHIETGILDRVLEDYGDHHVLAFDKRPDPTPNFVLYRRLLHSQYPGNHPQYFKLFDVELSKRRALKAVERMTARIPNLQETVIKEAAKSPHKASPVQEEIKAKRGSPRQDDEGPARKKVKRQVEPPMSSAVAHMYV
ncbi:Uu.00g111380.m01.CDS01 [Anthostomella pinea]|uniref:Uu.00g111380.m01.CDS01 n=1 Tax=Anthostomella pinea TaxID=933095 RepID=A0AAI8VG21_9PEZI|nr:Uu.00g111380.m01.CDS01 [Anthostomella pinea]